MKIVEFIKSNDLEGVISPSKKIFSLIFYFLVLLPFLCNFRALSFGLELIPLNLSFYGVELSKGNILIYGNFGTYFISQDNALSWKRKWLGNYDIIFHLTNYKDTLWGVLKSGYIIRSIDGGLNWEQNKIEIDSDDIALRLIVTDEFFYIRGIQTIYRYDRNYRILSSLKDTLLKVAFTEINDPGYPYPQIFLDYYKFYYVYDKLVVISSKTTKKGFIVIDKNLSNIRIINPCTFINEYNDSASIKRCGVTNIFFYQNKPVFLVQDENLYIPDENFTKWEYFFKDKSFANFRDSFNLKRWKEIVSPLGYYSDNQNLFNVKSVEWTYKNKFLSFGIILKQYRDTPKDTFITIGNQFIDPYIMTNYSSAVGRFSFGVAYNALQERRVGVFNDSIHIFVKDKNYIFLTTNNGKTWQLISFLNGKPYSILNDSTYFFVYPSSGYPEVCRTFDGGLTFLPNKRYFPGDTSYKDVNYNAIQLFFIDTIGIGFLTGIQSIMPYYSTVTENFWDNTIVVQTAAFNTLSNFTSNICKIGNKYLFALNDSSQGLPSYYLMKYYDPGDRKFHLLGYDNLDPKSVIKGNFFNVYYLISNGTFADLIAFGIVHDSEKINGINSTSFQIRQSYDSGRTFTNLHKIDKPITINQIYEHNRDSIFITFKQPDCLYLFDRTRDTLQLLWSPENEERRNPMLMVISDRFYIVGRGLFLENTDRSDLTKWREGKWDYGKPNFESVIFKGNVAIAGLSDSLRPFNYYKITLKKDQPSSVEQEQVEKRYYTTKFWASETYPQPAVTKAKARIAWDGSFDLHESLDGVYDSMGRKVEGKERISIVVRNRAWAEMEWECTGVPSGVYFILFRWIGGSEVVPVVVQ